MTTNTTTSMSSMDDYDNNDDEGFYGYVETSNDPGYSLLIATILFTIIVNMALPLMISLGNKYAPHNNNTSTNNNNNTTNLHTTIDEEDDTPNDVSKDKKTNGNKHEIIPPLLDDNHNHDDDDDDGSGVIERFHNDSHSTPTKGDASPQRQRHHQRPPSTYYHPNHHYSHHPTATATGDASSSVASSSNRGRSRDRSAAVPHSVNDNNENCADVSFCSSSVVSFSSASTSATASDMIYSRKPHRKKKQRRNRYKNKRKMMDKCHTEQQQQQDQEDENQLNHSFCNNYVDSVLNNTNINNDDNTCDWMGEGLVVVGLSPIKMKKNHDDSTAMPQHLPSSSRDHSPDRSLLSKIDIDEVSIDDAVSQYGKYSYPPKVEVLPHAMVQTNQDDDDDTCCNGIQKFWNQLLEIAIWDFEMKRIIKLAIPFGTQSFSTGIIEMLTVAIIGKLIGTKEVSAFVVVRTLVDITSSFFGGFHESLATLCSQSNGRNNPKLTGQYVQLSVIFYTGMYKNLFVLFL